MTKFYGTPCWVAVWFAAVMTAAVTARADYEAGQAAWDAGRHVEAVAGWQEAAQANDARAMLALGRAFVAGVGAPQDFVEAHKWLNLAAGLGNLDAVAERDALAAEMTVEERAEARRLARAWRTARDSPVADASPVDTAEPIAAPPSTTGAPPERALREAQELLAVLGYAPGPADGQWGRRSIQAYRSFLNDAGQEPSDVLTPEALQTMREMARNARNAAEAATQEPDALHRAVQAGDLDDLTAALLAGADPDQRDGRGWTAVMHAANKGYVLLVPPLLEADANANLRAPDGATALFMATAHGHSEIIAQLMEAGADVTVPGPTGKTAVDVARTRYGDVDTARQGGLHPAVLSLIRGIGLPKTFRDCASCPEMAVVPAGSFMMGSPPSEEGRHEDEGPLHRVTIARPFAVGKYEVTFAEWDACAEEGSCDRISDSEGWGRGTRPVINVSWNNAQAYVRWLSAQTGEQYRLLSEAEWEYAARAGSQTRYAWGDEVGSGRANCRRCDTRWDATSTAPVGSFPPNAFGLHDLHGNVAELVEDCWNNVSDNYAGAPADGTAWQQGDCSRRRLRGGSWFNDPTYLRSADRSLYTTRFRSHDVGFRVARPLSP